MELKQKGKTIILVPFDLKPTIEFCDRTIWLENKTIKMDGNPKDVTTKYIEYMSKEDTFISLSSKDQNMIKLAIKQRNTKENKSK